MEVYELVKELGNHSKQDIELVFSSLMEQGKIDFIPNKDKIINIPYESHNGYSLTECPFMKTTANNVLINVGSTACESCKRFIKKINNNVVCKNN